MAQTLVSRIAIGTVLLTFMLGGLLMITSPAFAQGTSGGGQTPGGSAGGGQTPGGSNLSVMSFTNPLKAKTIQAFLTDIIDIVLVFAVPIVVFFIILAGFKYVTAGGNEEKIKSATKALTWAVVGGVLVLGAKVLLEVIQGTVAALKN